MDGVVPQSVQAKLRYAIITWPSIKYTCDMICVISDWEEPFVIYRTCLNKVIRSIKSNIMSLESAARYNHRFYGPFNLLDLLA